MGHGLDVCLGDPAEADTLEECMEAEFVRSLVCNAGLVIWSQKPAELFSFVPRAWQGAADPRATQRLSERLFSAYVRLLGDSGLRMSWLARRTCGMTMLVWRPALVARVLEDPESRALARELGLPDDDAEALVRAVVGRLRAYYAGRAAFPHEVGLVLGFPAGDVRGFLADGGRGALSCGRWRVYGDVEAARARFDEYERQERRCKRLYAEGVPVRELLRMGVA